MIQDIYPNKLQNEYQRKEPSSGSRILCFRENQVFIRKREDQILELPEYKEVIQQAQGKLRYLFKINETDFFLLENGGLKELEEYTYENVHSLRQIVSKEICFAIMTGWHLAVWYQDNRFCGRCGTGVVHADRERMLRCPVCQNQIYPKIAPAVIVAVTDGDRLLLSKYADRDYKKYALLAGFTEIGETAEEAVKREVMEEVGLQVKNIRYYKSQPWGADSNLLLGFFCELAGEDQVSLDTSELAMAEWFDRDAMPAHDDGISLTREMMKVFELGDEITINE